MKVQVIDINGNKKSELTLPQIFSTKIRKDIVTKTFEALKINNMLLYSPWEEAGRRHSASGTISHRRHEWKGHYGKGISRVPRKTMWRRGTQFFWIGAEVSGTRGGRKAHAPTGIKRFRKINEKELLFAMRSAFASTANKEFIQERYSTLEKSNLIFPIILDSLDKTKSKEFVSFLRKNFGDLLNIAIKFRSIRPGKGKKRGRRYKSNAGILIVKSPSENFKMKGLDIRNVKEVSLSDLYPLGRITLFTQKAITELEKI